MSDISTWTILIFLIIYCPLVDISIASYANEISKPNLNLVVNETYCSNCSLSSDTTKPISFLQGLVIVTTDIFPPVFSFFFLVIPNFALLWIVIMMIRGVW